MINYWEDKCGGSLDLLKDNNLNPNNKTNNDLVQYKNEFNRLYNNCCKYLNYNDYISFISYINNKINKKEN